MLNLTVCVILKNLSLNDKNVSQVVKLYILRLFNSTHRYETHGSSKNPHASKRA